MKRFSTLRVSLLASCLVFALILVLYSQDEVQVGYAVLTADQGSNTPVATALFSQRNAQGVLVWETGVAAVEPIASGRMFMEQGGDTRTALALANPSKETLEATLILRNAVGTEMDRMPQTLGPGEHHARFVDELFAELGDFTGSLTFETDSAEQKLAPSRCGGNKTTWGSPSLPRCRC